MNKSTNKIIIFIIAAFIIVIGGIVCKAKGFNIELEYSPRNQIIISNNTGLDLDKIDEISKSILTDRKVKVQNVERFGNAIQISARSINEDEKKNLINKINEECNTDVSVDDTQIQNIPGTRIRDILKPYILPGIITFAAVLLYFIIVYHKIGLSKVLLKGICVPIVAELLYYAIIAITRIEFGRIANSFGIGLYILAVGMLAIKFQNQKEKLPKNNDKKEND